MCTCTLQLASFHMRIITRAKKANTRDILHVHVCWGLPFHIRCWRVGAAFAVGGRRRWSRAGEEFTFFAALLLAIFLAAGDFVVILLNEGSASVVFGDVVP